MDPENHWVVVVDENCLSQGSIFTGCPFGHSKNELLNIFKSAFQCVSDAIF